MPNRTPDPMLDTPAGEEFPPDSLSARLVRIEKSLGRIERSINGDEERGVVGLRLRVDRLEQRGRLVWTALVMALLALATLGWNALTGGKH